VCVYDEEGKLRVYEDRVPGRTFEPKRTEGTRDWKRPLNLLKPSGNFTYHQV
jgi:hypothetical protein